MTYAEQDAIGPRLAETMAVYRKALEEIADFPNEDPEDESMSNYFRTVARMALDKINAQNKI